MGIINLNKRCVTFDLGDQICKHYIDKYYFDNEKSVYEKMKEKPYIPKLFNLDKNKKEIYIEKIALPHLSDYVKSKGKIPYYLLNSLRKIRLDFYEKEFIDWGDFFKLEHIYIDEDNYSNNKVGIRVIDFDHCEPTRGDKEGDIKRFILQEFEELDSKEDKFKNTFQEYDSVIINDFFKNKIPL